MHRLLALVFASFVMVPATSGKALARAMGAGDVTLAQAATPAVVNIALWKYDRRPRSATHHVG